MAGATILLLYKHFAPGAPCPYLPGRTETADTLHTRTQSADTRRTRTASSDSRRPRTDGCR